MDASAPPTAAAQDGPTPYVGLRAFGREDRAWFFGRDRDAGLLVDKVLADRLTLLYALSGVGKSSLLRALVAPRLETEECRVLYFDDWAGSNPVAALKEAVAGAAQAIGITDPRGGSPTLAELCGLVAADGKTFVLLLDQFEEFLINHGNELDPLRKELGALLKATFVDARVLIALREEYLAALEPFRQDILGLFQSTYRLDFLDPVSAHQAIVGPAAAAGGEVEGALAERLMFDLQHDRARSKPRPTVQPGTAGGQPAWADRLLEWLTRLLRIVNATAPVPEADTELGTAVLATISNPIDLPTLQLVCEQVWLAAPVVDGCRLLTLSLYMNTLGGKDAILGAHFRSKMPAARSAQVLTARLMKFLAPSSGLKISYSAGDLASLSGLDLHRVTAELIRLSASDVRILRAREVGRHARYELLHDAQIRYIAPWRDEVLRAAARRRFYLRVGAVPAGVAVIAAGISLYRYVQLRQDIDAHFAELREPGQERTSRESADQRAMAAFDYTANRLLFDERSAGRLDLLKSTLQQNVKLLPPDYAHDRDTFAFLGNPPEARFVLRFRQGRPFDRRSFFRNWMDLSRANNALRGFSLQRPRLEPDPDRPRETVEFAGERDGVLVSLNWPELGGMQLVSTAKAQPAVVEFLERFHDQWIAHDELGDGKWYAVPRWSLPVWKAAGLRIEGESAYIALALSRHFASHPEDVLTRSVAQDLVQRVSRRFPCTAAEVISIRGSRLRDDLIQWSSLHQGRLSVPELYLVFDQLTDLGKDQPLSGTGPATAHPYFDAVSTPRVSDWTSGKLSEVPCKPITAATGGRGGTGSFVPFDSTTDEPAPKVRVDLGPELANELTVEQPVSAISTRGRNAAGNPLESEAPTAVRRAAIQVEERGGGANGGSAAGDSAESRDLSPVLVEAVEANRRAIYRQTGLWTPFPAFQTGSDSTAAVPAGYRVSVLDRSFEGDPAGPGTPTAERVRRLVADIASAVTPATAIWVDDEFVGALLSKGDLPPNIAKSVAATLSISDSKLLLRATLAAPAVKATASTSAPAPSAARSAGSIADPGWLLESLIFWKSYWPDAPSLADVAAQLRELGQRRLNLPHRASARSSYDLLESGLDELEADHADQAGALFKRALQGADRHSVAEAFMDRYAARWPRNLAARLRPLCEDPLKKDALSNPRLQALLQDLLGAAETSAADLRVHRDLSLCLLSSLPDSLADYRAKLQMDVSKRYRNTPWDTKSTIWLGLQMVRRFDPLRDPDSTLAAAQQLLLDGVRRADSSQAEQLGIDLIDHCQAPGPKNWCWKVAREVVEASTDASIAVDYAFAMAARQRPEEVRTAFDWLDTAKARFDRRPGAPDFRRRFDFFLAYARARAYFRMGMIVSSAADLKEAHRLLSSEVARWSGESPDPAGVLDLQLALARFGPEGSRAEAMKLADQERKDFPKNSSSWTDSVAVSVEAGDEKHLTAVMDELRARSGATDIADDDLRAFWFSASVAGFMSEQMPEESQTFARRFMRTDHPYAPLVAMLLDSETTGVAHDEAREIMRRRWREAAAGRALWEKRLRAGDTHPWYDLLLGYYLGEVESDRIFGPLASEAGFAASAFGALPFTRRDMLTEAWFYSALKSFGSGRDAEAFAFLHQVVDGGDREYLECVMGQRILALGRMPHTGRQAAGSKAAAPPS